MTITKPSTKHPDDDKVILDDAKIAQSTNPQSSYEGRKYEPEIDGPEQASQETDEVYADPRKAENLPAGGKSIDELNAHDLSKEHNQP